jgi:glycosyltransferase involved in cell wall biosynthesis
LRWTTPHDGSSESWSLVDHYDNVRAFYHQRNQGKGAALRTGFAQVTGDVVIIQDADLEYRPVDYPFLLEPIEQDVADVVYGSRMVGGRPHRVLFFWHYMGNRAVTTLSNMFTNLNLSDMEVGYKVFKAEVLKGIDIKSGRFGVEPELTAKIAKKGWRIYEVPIQYHGRDYAAGKKITWRDGIAAIYHIIRLNVNKPEGARATPRPGSVQAWIRSCPACAWLSAMTPAKTYDSGWWG